MDLKNTVIGLLLLGAAFFMMVWQGKQFSTLEVDPEAPSQTTLSQKEDRVNASQEATESSSLFHQANVPSTSPFEAVAKNKSLSSSTPTTLAETFFTLENEFIAVKFTTRGGSIKEVIFKKFPLTVDSPERFIFNQYDTTPALSLSFLMPGSTSPMPYEPNFKLVSKTESTILFSTQTPEGIKIYRGYRVNPQGEKAAEPYLIDHETRFVNNSQTAFSVKKLLINMGAYPPTRGDSFGEYLNAGYYNGKKANFIKSSSLEGSQGILGIGARPPKKNVEQTAYPILWGAIKNQFFTSVLTPNEPATGIYVKEVPLNTTIEEDFKKGLQANLELELGQIEKGEERLLSLNYYVGPKEFSRLDKLGQNQDLVMQFGFFGIISKFLLIIMTAVNKFVPNWGLTIIIVTLFIKLILWPLTAMQVRSSKRMAKIQEPLKAIKEKYKNNPQKVQQETMKLFKAYGVNPAAGCLPLFVQLPIFLGLYFMLRTASELRFASFLWVQDLSVPDTVMQVAGFPLNVLPLFMGLSMFLQMKMMPSPMTDNLQKKVFQLMPFIFLIFCYNFPSGLVLYWTVQNIFTIVQQAITQRMKDPLEVKSASDEGKTRKKNKSTKA